MGLGVLGRGVGDAAFLSECGAQVTVTDMKDESKLADSIAQLKTYPNITYHLGGHVESDFTNTDLVIKAAGVKLDSPYIQAARAHGVPVAMSTALFAQWARTLGVRIVGVTGTRGKSTVSYMIYHTLIHAQKHAVLGGNIRGISTLALLPDMRAGDIAVLELDSWQLQGFGDLRISPEISVFTNLMPDHQNYYPDMDAYFADKANIFRFQSKGDALFVGAEIAPRVRDARPPVEPTVVGDLAPDWQLKIAGDHNRMNASFAAAALLRLGLTSEAIRAGLESFDGVEGRLQFLGLADGVRVFNDNNATTPEATVAALRALDQGRRDIVLIAGGADKNLNLDNLVSEIQKTCKAVFLVAGTGTDRLKPMLPDPMVFQSLETAVDSAFNAAVYGDAVLFSPAFASFGAFTNEYERNDAFLALVRPRLI
jgi:UDP-N-acetylmuramoylalanine--D-glutamate ligase